MNIATQRLENEEHKGWWENGTSQYWDFIFRLQCKILDIDWNKNGINEQITQSFAWGNSYLLQTLNLGEDISNCPNYKKLQQLANEGKSTRNKVLAAMLDLFDPDIIIILNWDEYITLLKESDWEKTEYVNCELEIQADMKKIKIEHYKLKSINKDVIWTYHPRAMVFYKGGIDTWVKAVYEFMKSQKIIMN